MRCRLTIFIVLLITAAVVRAEVYKQIRVLNPDQTTLQKLSEFEPVDYRPGQYIEIIADESGFEKIKSLGIAYEIIHDDLTAFYQSRYPLGTTMGGFRTYSEISAFLDSMANNYPSLVTAKTSIGLSHEGRELWMVKVSDNPYLDEDEPEIFINGLHHAREPITSEVCVEFIKRLVENYGTDPEATELVDNNEFFILPIVNPDGYEYNCLIHPNGGGMWRKNRRNNGGSYGVDLNRNYPYFWGYDNSGSSGSSYSDVYRGPSAGSEPEIQAMMDFIVGHDFAWIMNYHSYSNLLLWPWGYNGIANDDADTYRELFGDYAEDTLGYEVGTAWQTLRYNANGDACDWGFGDEITKKKMYAITIEIGGGSDGFWPPPERIPVLAAENINALLNFSHKAYEIYKRRKPPAPDIIEPIAAPVNQSIFLRWQTTEIDTFNNAINYKVMEKSGYQVITQTCETASDFNFNEFLLSSARFHGGAYSLYSGQNYNRRATVTLKERLDVSSGDTLIFWTWYDIQNNYDYAYVEASTDGQTWIPLNGDHSTDYNPNNHNEGHGITGSSGGWLLAKYDISDYIGQEINIRFRYWTDGATTGEGIYIDDIHPYETFLSSNLLTESVAGDSLLIGLYESGTYYFQVAARDDRGDLSEWSRRFAVEISDEVYTVSGLVELMDNPVSLEGSVVKIIGLGLIDTTDLAGHYSISDVPAGIYNITANHYGYFSAGINDFHVFSDTVTNFLLEPIPDNIPILITPIDGTVFDTFQVNFSWQEVDDANRYCFELATDELFDNIIVIDSNLSAAMYDSDSLANSWYWWRVKGAVDQNWAEYSEVWSILVDYDASYVDFLPGDANGDWWVTGSDVTFLVGYFRSANPRPDPFLAGDANGDCVLTGPDVTYLVNFFRGTGDPPIRGDCQVVINYKAGSAEDF